MIKISDTSLNDLGFDTIKKLLVEQSNSKKNKQYFSTLKPHFNITDLLTENKYTSEILVSLEKKNIIPNDKIPESSEWINLLKIPGSKLTNEDFKDIYTFITIFIKLKNIFKYEHFDLWKSELLGISELVREKEAIKKIFDDNFSIKHDASLNLKKIIKEIEALNNNLEKQLNSILKKYKEKQWLQENKFYWQNGRSVLPLISKYKNKVKGVIHGESATNQTSFVEPLEIINLNNQIYSLKVKKKKEENKILENLTVLFHEKIATIKSVLILIYKYDKHNAIAKVAFQSNSIKPKIDSKKSLLIKNGINPIISMTKNAIPLNLKLENSNCIIITGPNAGGKTVVLKTVGLFYVMAYSGLFIPAEKIILPSIDVILTDIGDGQSIENDLSTFSAHIKNLSYMINKSTPNTLILIDEIGTGTDPVSGAAISISVLDNLLSKGSLIIGSTHLNQIKNWAHNKKVAENARMIFDFQNLKPTFKLELGLPGSSYCFEIAKKMGISDNIISESKKLVDSDNLKVENLIENLEREKDLVTKKYQKLDQKLYKTKLKEKELDEKIEELKQNTLQNKKIINLEIQRIISSTKKEINDLMKDFHASKGNTKASNKIKERIKSIQKRYQIKEKKNYELIDILKIEVGQELYIPNLKMNGIVESINKKKEIIKVNCAGKKIHTNLCDLTFPLKNKIKNNDKIHDNNNIIYAKSNKIDLRGMSKVDAIEALEKCIDKAILSNLNQLHIIHGIGNGILQEAVHEYLSKVNSIKFGYAHPNDGGYGATYLQLKDS